jgi:transcriptional regulator with XRE-family HTH domain
MYYISVLIYWQSTTKIVATANNAIAFLKRRIMPRMGLGVRIKAARRECGLTQLQLGKAVGIKQSSVSQLERGDTMAPKGTTILDIAAVLQVNAQWLMTGKGPRDPVEGLTPEAIALAADWQRLNPQNRERIAQYIRHQARADQLIPDVTLKGQLPAEEAARLRNLAADQPDIVFDDKPTPKGSTKKRA